MKTVSAVKLPSLTVVVLPSKFGPASAAAEDTEREESGGRKKKKKKI